MGISGLLPLISDACRDSHLREFQGKVVGVDALCLLHKGGFACATALATGVETYVYVSYIQKFVDMMLKAGIRRIVLVFDGEKLPAKQLTNDRRKQRREEMKKQGKSLLLEGKDSEAFDKFKQSVEITKEMISKVLQSFRAYHGVDCIIAPYEADAQLTYLAAHKFIDLIVTEDSDLIAFGCEKIFFKLHPTGTGRLYDRSKLTVECLKNTQTCRRICILAGCDYLDSLAGIALKTAVKFFAKINPSEPIETALPRLPFVLKKSVDLTADYVTKFVEAENTFLHQIVFDPKLRKRVPLTPFPEEDSHLSYPYCGKLIDSESAYQMSLGNLNPTTRESFEPKFHPTAIDPKTKKMICGAHSIWNPNFQPGQPQTDRPPDQPKISTAFGLASMVKSKSSPATSQYKKETQKNNSPGIMRGSIEEEILKAYKVDIRQSTNLTENLPTHHIQEGSRFFALSQSQSSSSSADSSGIKYVSLLDSLDKTDESSSSTFTDSQPSTVDTEESTKIVRSPCSTINSPTKSETEAKRKRNIFGSPPHGIAPISFNHSRGSLSQYTPVTPSQRVFSMEGSKTDGWNLRKFQFSAKRVKLHSDEDFLEPQTNNSAPTDTICIDLTADEYTHGLKKGKPSSKPVSQTTTKSTKLGPCASLGMSRKNTSFIPPLLNKPSSKDQTAIKDYFFKKQSRV